MERQLQDDSSTALGALEQLPADIFASHIWSQLSRRDRRRLRQCCRGMVQYAASGLMTHLQVLVCRASLMHLTSSERLLHHRFPRPTSLLLRLMPPNRRDEGGAAGASASAASACTAAAAAAAAAGGGDGGGGAGTGPEGWYGSTAVMSYFLSELGMATSVTSLSLQGWQELSPRDLHHVTACYPRLARLHLAGLPYNNYLSGPSLEPLGHSAPWLRELVIDTQVVMDVQSALDALCRLPRLASLQLSGLPLLPSLDLPLHRLGAGLTRLDLTLEHKHPHSEQQLADLGALSGLRHLALDFMQLGTGSSLWSAGWLLTHVISRLTGLTTLHLPRAFLYDKSHPDFLRTLAALPYLTDLALGSVILSPETAAAAAASTAAPAAADGVGDDQSATAAAPPGSASAAPAFPSSPHGEDPARYGAADRSGSDSGGAGSAGPSGSGGCSAGPSGSLTALPPPPATSTTATRTATSTTATRTATLARPWRRLALGAAMPCYLECLLPTLGVRPATMAPRQPPLDCPSTAAGVPIAAVPAAAAAAAAGAAAGAGGRGPAEASREGAPEGSFAGQEGGGQQQQWRLTRGPSGLGRSRGCADGHRGGIGVGGDGGGDGDVGGGGAGLELLELSTPSTLPMVQLLPQFVRQGCRTNCGRGNGGCQRCGGDGSGVREVRLLLRLASNWREVVAALVAVGPALTSLALMPTYLYGSGTMMTAQALLSVVSALPHLTHLELYRLNIEPRDVTCLADMSYLRYALLGVAEEAGERRGHGHPAALVRELLAALHTRWSCRQRDSNTCANASGVPAVAAVAAGSVPEPEVEALLGAGVGGSLTASMGLDPSGIGGGICSGVGVVGGERTRGLVGSSRAVVVCCPELTEEEEARLDEMCEIEYGTYDTYGSRLRVERTLDASLPWRLAVGCSLAPGRWRP